MVLYINLDERADAWWAGAVTVRVLAVVQRAVVQPLRVPGGGVGVDEAGANGLSIMVYI